MALAPFSQTHVAGTRVLLTFDDGPHAEFTPAVLDRLAVFGLRAAFFVIGNRVYDQSLLERIANNHTVGNHTHTHAIPRWRHVNAAFREVRACQAVVPRATQFRAPLGRLTPALWLAARRTRLACVNWSLDSGDWRCRTATDAKQCAREVLQLVRPGDIVLFHDNHKWIVPILDEVLPAIASRFGAEPITSTSALSV
jgi:peptidoglycan/xylan/chitin deacetylase (PgdA/CDA1 family)